MKKRRTALLFLVVVLALISLVLLKKSAEASTGGRSRAEAVAWARSQLGNSLDYDGVYGAQCVDLTKYYYVFLGQDAPRGSANEYYDGGNFCPSGWSYQNYPVAGSVAVWTGGTYGHVAIVTSVSDSSFSIVEQNYNYQDWCTERTISRSSSDVTIFIHPDFPSDTYTLDINGYLDNTNACNVTGFATFDVYLNNTRVANDVDDYCNTAVPVGTSYRICDIRPKSGKAYDGPTNDAVIGTPGSSCSLDVRLKFHTVDATSFISSNTPTVSTYNGHTYYFYSKKTTWHDAYEVAKKLGGYLVTINSSAEDSYVYNLANKKTFWTGLTDQGNEGTFKWINGESASYRNWASGQPDNAQNEIRGEENYGEVTTSGKWNDVYPFYSSNAGFMVEFNYAYTVSYNLNGGSGSIPSQTKPYGRSITLSTTTPTRTGYDFKGWATSASGSVAYQPGGTYSANANVTLYAVWQAKKYILDVNGCLDGTNANNVANYATFDVYLGGSKVADDTTDFYREVAYDTSYRITDIRPLSGKAYYGTVSGNNVVGTMTGKLDIRLKLNTVDAAGYVGKYTPKVGVYNDHTYYYFSIPVTWYEAYEIAKHLGGYLVAVGTAEENSYIWSLTGDIASWIGLTDRDAEGTWKWINGGTSTYRNWKTSQPDNSQSNQSGAENYAHFFAGANGCWNDNCSYAKLGFTVEFDAAYSVTYDANGGTGAPAKQAKAYGKSLVLSSTKPTRTGYTFKGWATSASGSVAYQPGGTYSENASVTLYAVWEANTYNLYLYKNYSRRNYLVDSDFASGTLNTDYWFSRNTDIATIAVDTTQKHNGYNSLKIINTSAGDMNWKDGKGQDLAFVTTSQGSNPNDNFVGDAGEMVLSFWAKSSVTGSKIHFRWGFEQTTRCVSLTTEWRQYVIPMNREELFGYMLHPYVDQPGTVWLTELQLEDGDGISTFVPEHASTPIVVSAQYGGTYAAPEDPARTAFIFEGWYTAPAGGEKLTFPLTVKAGHETAYAHWKIRTYKVTYDANGGTGAPSAQTKTYGKDLTLRTAKPTRSGYTFLGWATSPDGEVKYQPGGTYTKNAKVTLYAVWYKKTVITKQPVNAKGTVGSTVSFSVTADGGTRLQYKWQFSKDGKTWSSWSIGKKINVNVTEVRNKYKFRCVITDIKGKKTTSDTVTLTVIPEIVTQPKGTSAYVNGTAKYTVEATGAGLKYRWQVSKDGGLTWKNVTDQNEGYNTPTLKLTVKAAWNGYRYRCVIKDANGKVLNSNGAKLTVKPKITAQPAAASAKAGATAKFTVTATGAGLKYRWQVSKDGGSTWTNVTSANEGYNTATLKLVVKSAWNGYRYRCVIKDANGKVLNSSGAKLTVK